MNDPMNRGWSVSRRNKQIVSAVILSVAAAANLPAQAHKPTLTVLSQSGPPVSTLGPDGTLYGCTLSTVNSLTPPASPGGSWTNNVLYTFAGGSDGSNCNGVTMGSGGVLYGTTSDGGSFHDGVVFSLRPPVAPGGAWTEAILHDFNGDDGSFPQQTVTIGKGGVLYGSTVLGGTGGGNGVVYSLTPPASPGDPWNQTVLCTFAENSATYGPKSVVIDAHGVVYGVTSDSVFSLTPPSSPEGAWTETQLFLFEGSTSAGFDPSSVVVGSGPGGQTVLYGTTIDGGIGFGTVFSLTPPTTPGNPWTETVIHDFPTAPDDGMDPGSLLITPSGVLVGTTVEGGVKNGTIFWLTPPATPGAPWTEAIYRFPKNGSTGIRPGALVQGKNGIFYGSTETTVFAVKR